MLSSSPLVQCIAIFSALLTVNGFPQMLTNSIDVPISDQRNQFLLKKIIEIMTLVPGTKTTESESEETYLQNKIIFDEDVNFYQPPKRRVKRFICWHSCLGSWKKRNPKLKKMRHSIANVIPGASNDPVVQDQDGSGSPKSKRSSIYERGLMINQNEVANYKKQNSNLKTAILSKGKDVNQRSRNKTLSKSPTLKTKKKLKEADGNFLLPLRSDAQEEYENYSSLEEDKEDDDYDYNDTNESINEVETETPLLIEQFDKTTSSSPLGRTMNDAADFEVVNTTVQPIQSTLPSTLISETLPSTAPMHPIISTTIGMEFFETTTATSQVSTLSTNESSISDSTLEQFTTTSSIQLTTPLTLNGTAGQNVLSAEPIHPGSEKLGVATSAVPMDLVASTTVESTVASEISKVTSPRNEILEPATTQSTTSVVTTGKPSEFNIPSNLLTTEPLAFNHTSTVAFENTTNPTQKPMEIESTSQPETGITTQSPVNYVEHLSTQWPTPVQESTSPTLKNVDLEVITSNSTQTPVAVLNPSALDTNIPTNISREESDIKKNYSQEATVVTPSYSVTEAETQTKSSTIESEVTTTVTSETDIPTTFPAEEKRIQKQLSKNEEELRKIEEQMQNTQPQLHDKIFNKSIKQLGHLRTMFTHMKPNATDIGPLELPKD